MTAPRPRRLKKPLASPRPRLSPIRNTYEELRIERLKPVPVRSREERQLDDLRELIHLLAMALTEGKAVA